MLLVLAVLATAGTAYRLDWSIGPEAAAPKTPAAVAPPPGLDLPALQAPRPVAEPATGAADPGRVRRAIAPLLKDRDLGSHVLATVSSLDGKVLYSSGSGRITPASTMKLLTSTAVLSALGPDHTFTTTAVAAGRDRVVLVGGGDPLLSAADLKRLARATATELRERGTKAVRVGYDTSLFTGPAVSPHWPATYIGEAVVSPITALWVDEGRDPSGWGRVADPAAVAATTYAAALGKAGVTVRGTPREQSAPRDAGQLARVESAPLSRLVEHTLEVSDNEAAEVLARQTAIAVGAPASFSGAARAVLDEVEKLGVPTDGARVYDGSGLSREDRLAPGTLTGVLETAAAEEHPELRAVVTGLPVAGFTGSLAARFTQTADESGRGMVRAKTGTLTGVSGLAGIVTDRGGVPLLFAFLADRIDPIDTLDARAALDGLTSALAGCRCGGAG